MNSKLAAAVLVPVAFVVVVAVALVLAGSSGEDGDETSVATLSVATASGATASVPPPTATGTPLPGATPAEGPGDVARGFAVAEAPEGILQFVTDPAGIPEGNLGAYFQDVETGAIEGWNVLLEGTHHVAFSADNRFTLFQRDEQVFRGGVIYPAGQYLADRGTGNVYHVEGDARAVIAETQFNGSQIASEGSLVLFHQHAAGAERFIVIDVEASPAVRGLYLVDSLDGASQGVWGGFSSDGSRFVAVSENLVIVDLTGETTPVNAEVWGAGRPHARSIAIRNVAGGDSFLVLAEFVGGDASPGRWMHFDWDGDLLAEGAGLAFYPSPDGTRLAIYEPFGDDALQSGLISAVATADGSPLFRAVGVTPWFSGHSGANRWLADNSGFVVSDSRLQMSYAMQDGTLGPYVGAPSPSNADRFVVGGSIVDGHANVVMQSVFPVSARDFVPPFGASGSEMRILTPFGGHDCCRGNPSLIQPFIDLPPYDDQPVLRLVDAAEGAELRNAPAGDTVVGTLTVPGPVTLHEVRTVCTDDSGPSIPMECRDDPYVPEAFDAYYGFLVTHGGFRPGDEVWAPMRGYWARVTTADGIEGWLLLQLVILGL